MEAMDDEFISANVTPGKLSTNKWVRLHSVRGVRPEV